MNDAKTTELSKQLQAILLDNALDFLLSTAEAVHRDEGHRSLKEAVLHLANGVELMLKAKLAQEHWSLIFASVDQASYGKIADTDFRSVDFPQALGRLEQVVGVTIGKSSTDHLKSLRKLRNQLTHFSVQLDPAQTKSLVAKGMNFSVEFCEQQNMVTSDAEDKLGDIHINLTDLQEFVNERMATILKGVHHTLIWTCPDCWQEALAVEDGVAQCQFCRHDFNPQELAADKSEGIPEDCPHCLEGQTFALVLSSNDEGMWVCFSCGEHGEHYYNCMRCSLMDYFPDGDDVKICTSCWEYIRERG